MAQQEAAVRPAFGGSYSTLRPEQRRLIDDWFKRFSVVVKKAVDPAEAYDKLPLSARTTFNAVTHALLMTKLTGDSGDRLAESALDLVAQIDSVAGQVLGAGGDEQFRIYVEMKPGVLQLLERSTEFGRGPDNAIYHKGYPTCYRTKGTPSIQISLTHDAVRADIDVDYRSSKFPVFLLNGHLSASNSDVRAGDNDSRHNHQWAGLQNWWRNLLGLPLIDTPQEVKVAGRVISNEPKLKNAKPADAIHGFLNDWLVEQQPNESIAYFSEESFACMEAEKGTKVDYGTVKFSMLQSMIEVNRRIGKVSSLREASIGVAMDGERVKEIEQPYRSEFVLYDVREDLAEQFRCVNRLDASQISTSALKSKAFGKYVGAVFRIKAKDQTGAMVATLWRKEHDYWMLISYDVDPEIGRSRVPSVGAQPPATASLPSVSGDKNMIRAASEFLKQWLVKKNIDKAIAYLDPGCFACVKLYLDDDVRPPSTPEDTRTLLRNGMTRTAAVAGAIEKLESAIAAPPVHHQDIKLVKHPDAKAFVIASIPEYMAGAADCENRKSDGGRASHSAPVAATGYGKYYATAFSLAAGKTNPGVLWIVWEEKNDAWRAVSYVLITP